MKGLYIDPRGDALWRAIGLFMLLEAGEFKHPTAMHSLLAMLHLNVGMLVLDRVLDGGVL